MNIILFCFLIIEACIILYLFKQKENIRKQEIKESEIEQQKVIALQKELNDLATKKSNILQDITKANEEFEKACDAGKERFNERLRLYKNSADYAADHYVATIEERYDVVEEEFYDKILQLKAKEEEQQKKITLNNLKIEELKETISAGVRARERERELREQLDFYKLNLSESDMDDIEQLEKVKKVLHQPVILNKLIWSTYFQKQTNDLCARILGTNDKVCGIYKITSLVTKQCYIGQSVDVATRWKDHIKCGLGIEASSTNKLYNAMQEQGVWRFTFELMEKCEREQLNEKESFWIDMYNSANLGYNTTKGNK